MLIRVHPTLGRSAHRSHGKVLELINLNGLFRVEVSVAKEVE
jgi:hypothetical protein